MILIATNNLRQKSSSSDDRFSVGKDPDLTNNYIDFTLNNTDGARLTIDGRQINLGDFQGLGNGVLLQILDDVFSKTIALTSSGDIRLDAVTEILLDAANIRTPSLPTSDPGVEGRLYSLAGVVHVSVGG